MKHSDFLNFKTPHYLQKCHSNIQILKQVWFRYEKNVTYLQTKTSFAENESFRTTELKLGNPLPILQLNPAYPNQLPLPARKKMDQYEYIQNGIIPYSYLEVIRKMPSNLSEEEEEKVLKKIRVAFEINLIEEVDQDK